MGKLDGLRQMAGDNILESMGAGRASVPREPVTATRTLPPRLQGITRSQNSAEIPIDKIGPDPDQPREDFDTESLNRLAVSLKSRGQLQPVRVRWSEERGQYILVCGERRWRAAQLAGLTTMSCVIIEGSPTPAELLAIQVTENALREDLRPVEAAKAYKALMDLNGWSVRQVAAELAITHSAVVKALALLDLPEPIQEQVEQGTLAPGTAYELSKIDDRDTQAEVAAQAVASRLSRDEVAATVRHRTAGQSRPKGRGGQARKVTSRTLRTSAGYKIIAECRRGIEPKALVAALWEAAVQVEAETSDEV